MPFQILSKKEIFKGKFKSLWETKYLDKNGNERIWEWVFKKDYVSVLAITAEQELVIIKQYRVANEKYVYQPVAGEIDTTDETPEATAQRELMEEIGYGAEKFIALRPQLNSPGTLTNLCYPFIALNAYPVNNNRGDESEEIELVKIPMDKLYEFYQNCPEDCDFSMRTIATYEIAKHLHLL